MKRKDFLLKGLLSSLFTGLISNSLTAKEFDLNQTNKTDEDVTLGFNHIPNKELKTMNIQMRIITEDNIDQLLTLTEGDDIAKLTNGSFLNLEQVQNRLMFLINPFVWGEVVFYLPYCHE